MIEAVLFDLFETLITESGLAPTRASSLARVLGVEETRYRAEWKAGGHGLSSDSCPSPKR